MVATSLPIPVKSDSIRKINLSTDLLAVADLIELCFPLHLDPDGQSYVREMRKTAQSFRLMGWLVNGSDLGTATPSGFVWEEQDRIVGNLSLIPLQREGRRVHMIANVAVHPDFRRRGIARKLTQYALSYLDRQSASQVWLQVRDDNQPAMDLYHSLGFKAQAARMTWRFRPGEINTEALDWKVGLTVRRRAREDWSRQRDWLEEAYPDTVRWNLPVNFRRFTPGLIQSMTNFFEGKTFRHFALLSNGKCQGVITWQKSDSFANNLWLAIADGMDKTVLPIGLVQVARRFPKNHPLSIDYPAGRFEEGFRALGFEHFRTLVWMRRSRLTNTPNPLQPE